jgi:N-acetylneuraminic acid mutarotase
MRALLFLLGFLAGMTGGLMPIPVVTAPADDSYYQLKNGTTVLVTLEASFREVDPLPRRNLTPVRTPGGSTLFYRGDGRPLPGLKVLEGLIHTADEWALGTRLAAIRTALATADTLARVTPDGTTTWALESEPVPGYLTDSPASSPGKAFQRRVTLFLLATQLAGEPAATIPTVTLPDPITGTPGSVTYPGASADPPPSVTIPSHPVMGGTLSPGSWTVKADMPGGRFKHAGAVLGGKLYVVSGEDADLGGYSASVFAYDPSTNTWATLASLPAARSGLAAAALGSYLYAVGGRSGPFNIAADLYRYDPTADSWTTLTSMPTGRRDLVLVPFGGKLYAIGGNTWPGDGGYTLSGKVEAYDPATNSWATLDDLPVARTDIAAFPTSDRIVVAGGTLVISSQDQATDVVHEFDPVANDWSTAPSMPVRTAEASGVLSGSYGYVMGGQDHPYSGNARALRYDPATGSWAALAALPIWRVYTAAGAIGGKVYVAGGEAGDDDYAATLEFTP